MEINKILDWLYEHIGLDATIVFIFLTLVVSATIIVVVKFMVQKRNSNGSWGEVAGRLKDAQHKAENAYFDFKSNQMFKDSSRLQALKDRYSYAKDRRKWHLDNRPNKKPLTTVLLLILLCVVIFYLINNNYELILSVII